MRDDGWMRENPVPRAKPKAVRTPAKGYARPEVLKVALELDSDSDEFRPSPCDQEGSSGIVANIPDGETVIPHGGAAVVDCGFGVKLPAGYRCRVKGYASSLVFEVVGLNRFKVHATNLGEETILRHGEPIGRLWIEPVHFFEWSTRG